MAHTPGPWKAYFYVRNKRLKIGDWGWVQVDGYRPVPLTHTKQHKSEDAANARLISAAPDLFHACRAVADDLHRLIDGDDFCGMSDTELFTAFLTVLEPALDKAEGRING